VLHREGQDRSWAGGRGATPSDKDSVNDVNFLSMLIDKLSGQYRIVCRINVRYFGQFMQPTKPVSV
jgi:hypothetical protein